MRVIVTTACCWRHNKRVQVGAAARCSRACRVARLPESVCELTRSFGRWAPAAAGCAPRSWPPLDRGSAHKAALGWLGAHLGRQAHAQGPGLLMAPIGRTTVRSSRIGWAARRGVLGKTQPSGAAGLGRRRAGEYLAIPAVHGSLPAPGHPAAPPSSAPCRTPACSSAAWLH